VKQQGKLEINFVRKGISEEKDKEVEDAFDKDNNERKETFKSE
jgi:hypothetical protein